MLDSKPRQMHLRTLDVGCNLHQGCRVGIAGTVFCQWPYSYVVGVSSCHLSKLACIPQAKRGCVTGRMCVML
jgi:hypothetical protein